MTPKELKRLKKLRKRQMEPPECEVLAPRWHGTCVIAATGLSLTKDVATACMDSGHPIIAVKQAWRRVKSAEVLYSLDSYWWHLYKGVPEFAGEKWSAHDSSLSPKIDLAQQYGLRLVRGALNQGFSTDPAVIHYGRNTGFQAINLAIHWLHPPKKRIILVGFDMHGGYFFGDHPRGPQHGKHWPMFISEFEHAAKHMPDGVEIVNATEGSKLRVFPRQDLETALAA
jgi:hypothetical protein